MKMVLFGGVVFSIACSACKPVVQLELVSKEQSPFLLRSMREAFRNALQSGNFTRARQILRGQKPSQLHHNLVLEQVRVMHYRELVGLVEGYRVHIPPDEKISQQLKQIDSSIYSSELRNHLQQLKNMIMMAGDDFDRFSIIINTAKAGISDALYMQQTERLNTEFMAWAEPLREQVKGALENFYRRDGLRDATPTLEQVMHADVYEVWQEIETILVKPPLASD